MTDNLIERLSEEWANLDPVDPLRGLIRDAIAALSEARAAIERQSVPAGSLALDAAIGYIERHTPHLVYSEIKAALAAAPHPQPDRQSVRDLNRLAPFVGGLGKAILQELIEDMAAAPQPQQKKCWCAACDMAKNVIQTRMALCPECGDKRCPKAMRHDAACSAAPQPQPVQEQCPECDGTGTVAGSQAHFPCPICTSPQAQPPSENTLYLLRRLLSNQHTLTGKELSEELTKIVSAHGITKGTT